MLTAELTHSDSANTRHVMTVPHMLLHRTQADVTGPVVEVDNLPFGDPHHALGQRDGVWVQGGGEALQLGVLRDQAEPVLVSAAHHDLVVSWLASASSYNGSLLQSFLVQHDHNPVAG